MKKLLTILLVLVALSASAQTAGIIQYRDVAGGHKDVSDASPLPTSGVVTIGTATFEIGSPPTLNQTTTVTVTSVAQNLTSFANRRTFFVQNIGTETIWLTMDTSAASATVSSGIAIYSHGFMSDELDEGKVIGAVCSTSADLTFYQTGD